MAKIAWILLEYYCQKCVQRAIRTIAAQKSRNCIGNDNSNWLSIVANKVSIAGRACVTSTATERKFSVKKKVRIRNTQTHGRWAAQRKREKKYPFERQEEVEEEHRRNCPKRSGLHLCVCASSRHCHTLECVCVRVIKMEVCWAHLCVTTLVRWESARLRLCVSSPNPFITVKRKCCITVKPKEALLLLLRQLVVNSCEWPSNALVASRQTEWQNR